MKNANEEEYNFRVVLNSYDNETGEMLATVETEHPTRIAASQEFYRIRNILHAPTAVIKSTKKTRYDLILIKREGNDSEWELSEAKRIFI